MIGIKNLINLAIAITFSVFFLQVQADENINANVKIYQGSKEKLHVYLLVGQSNMAGRARIPAQARIPNKRCYLLNRQDKWEQARNPFNKYSTIRKGLGMQHLNPGYSFAKKILKSDSSISVGLVVNAKGGTGIKQWAKGGKFYNESIRRIKIAQKSGVLKGIIWHQGENDAVRMNYNYLKELKVLIADFRRDLSNDKLIFIAGQIRQAKSKRDKFDKGSKLINDQISKLPLELPFTGFVSFKGLKTTDHWHFDTKSMLVLGERYAEKILKLCVPIRKK